MYLPSSCQLDRTGIHVIDYSLSGLVADPTLMTADIPNPNRNSLNANIKDL